MQVAYELAAQLPEVRRKENLLANSSSSMYFSVWSSSLFNRLLMRPKYVVQPQRHILPSCLSDIRKVGLVCVSVCSHMSTRTRQAPACHGSQKVSVPVLHATHLLCHPW